MGLDFDVLEFCKKLRQNRPPPYQCPLEKCDKVYKSLCGLQYHLVNYDHDNPTPATPAVAHNRKKGRYKAPVPTGDIALQSPPKEALTFAEAQKVVQFEIDGKISRIPIDQTLPVISLDEWEKKNAELDKPLSFAEPISEPRVKLPEASFKLIEDYNERVSDAPPRPNAYIRYIEKSAEELDGEVEYDVDEEDTAWLAIINKTRVKQNLPPVSVDTLEMLMDRLEKESYFQASQSGQQPGAVVDEDAVCCICMDGECQNTNVILFCDMCNLAVHQDCYGVPYIPEGQWLCRRCLQSPSRLVNCVLCPNTGGAFKQTDQSTWAHVVCALWIPEVRFANTVFLEPIDSIEMIPAARWKLQCMVCKQRGAGACIQCHKPSCYSAFHVTCAQQAGLYMKMEAGSGREPSQPVQVAKMAYCDAHTPAHVLLERRAALAERDERDECGEQPRADLSAVRQKSREKIKQARRVLARARTWTPVVSVPTLPAERVAALARRAGGPAPARALLVARLLAYWTLKRHARNGVPLLRRLQSLATHHGTRGIQDGTVNVRELCNQLKYWQRIRQDLERARLLCELVRKRERLKAEYTRVWERCVLHSVRPEQAALHKLLRMLRQRDTSDIFTEPVDLQEVPDYSTIVKQPMDLSSMGKKLDRGAYKTVDDVEADFKLMIDNCLAYNNKDTVFYKAGVKMREQCAPVFREARRDLRAGGMKALAGEGEDAPEKPPTSRARSEARSEARIEAKNEARNEARSEGRIGARREVKSEISVKSEARSERARSRARSVRRRSTDSDRTASVARSERRAGVAADSDDDNVDRAVSSASRKWWRGRGGARARGRRGRRGALRSRTDNDTATSGSETAVPVRKSVERKLVTPDKSPLKTTEPAPTSLGLMGALRKPTLLLTPSTSTATPTKSFGSDATLPTLSPGAARASEPSPKKKGRGRPKKHDKAKPTPDLFRSMSGEAPPLPVPASFLQYRGPAGELGSDTDSRSSSSSSAWSQSCSSCTHYDDDGSDRSDRSDRSGRTCSLSGSDDSSCNDTLESAEGGTARKGRGTRSGRAPRGPQAGSLEPLQPLQLVWAKCRGYPWYPALIIDPKMPKGYTYKGVPLPVPPTDVLNLKKNHSHEPILYLVLFFDVKRTWQWLPPNKLEILGVEKSIDQAKVIESRKPTERKAVKKAYEDAMQFRKQVDGDK